MTAKKTSETSAVASTAVEREHRPPVEPPKSDTFAVAEPPPKPPKRTTSIKAACKRWPHIRELYVRSLAHLFGHESGDTYNLAAFMGTTAGVRILIADHIKQRVPTQRAEQRMNEALRAHKMQLHPAPDEIVQQKSINPRTQKEIAPQIKRAIGPSEYASTLALVFEIRALEAVCNKAALLEMKKSVIRAQIELDHVLKEWGPFVRPVPLDAKDRRKIEAHRDKHPSTLAYDDSMGEVILKARLNLASCEIAVRQRESLKAHLKTLRNSHSWLIGILKHVASTIEAGVVEQEKADRAANRVAAMAAIKSGFETDFFGRRWDRFLSEQERRDLAAAKEELERDLSVETENK